MQGDHEWKKRGYYDLEQIGQGSFGKVYCGKKKGDTKKYALKIIDNVNSHMIEQIENEVNAMKKITCPYTLSLVENFYDENEFQYVLVTEYLGGGDLNSLIFKKAGNWTLQEIIALLAQITLAFIEMNERQMAHRDLKPENILIDDRGFYKVCDFGCAKFININASKFLLKSKPFGTQLYNSPEVYNNEQYNYNADVWSMGAILYLIVYRKPHIKVDKDLLPNTEYFMEICTQKRPIPFPEKEGLNPQLLELLKSMLQVNKAKRIQWKEVQKQVYTAFPFIIYKREQLYNHQTTIAKILCQVLELLTLEETVQELQEVGLERSVKSNITKVLILLQYDELEDGEQALATCGHYRGGFIMPHILTEEKDPAVQNAYQTAKKKNLEFRKAVPGTFAIAKLREAAIKQVNNLKGKLEEATAKSPKKRQNLPRIIKALDWLREYSSLFEVANNGRLNTVFDQMFPN